MRPLPRRRALAAIATLTILAASAAAEAARNPLVAVQADGTAHFGYVDDDGSASVVQERRWHPGALPGRAQWVGNAGDPADTPDMAVDAAGNATFTWQRRARPSTVLGRRRTADGTLQPVLPLSPENAFSLDPHVASSPAGSSVLVWTRLGESSDVIQMRRLSAAGALGPVVTLSALSGRASEPEVAMDGNGNALVVWKRRTAPSETEVVQIRRVAADGGLGAVTTLSAASAEVRDPLVGFDADGDAIVAWTRFDGSKHVPQLRHRSSGGTLSSTQTLLLADSNADGLALAVAPDGSAITAWSRASGDGSVVQARHRAAAGTLGAVTTLAPAAERTFHSRPDVAMDQAGNAIMVWDRAVRTEGGAPTTVLARRRAAGGPFGSVQTISVPEEESFDPAIAAAPDGSAVIAWQVGFLVADPSIAARRRGPAGGLGNVESIGF